MNITSSSDLTMEEMTDASERIYNEVGEDADIIWGAVVDDNMGEDMSVTVIATGIGGTHDIAGPRKAIDHTLRGRVRDLTPAGLQNAVDYDQPTYIRHQEAVGEASGATYRGYKGIVLDNDDLDVPTFLRKKAD
jgi:cell division protein FtsZ